MDLTFDGNNCIIHKVVTVNKTARLLEFGGGAIIAH